MPSVKMGDQRNDLESEDFSDKIKEGTNYLIIGVSGTTNAGKTSLVAKLKKMFPQAETMCLDKYFLEPDDESLKPYIVPEVDHVNWEQFGALDMDRMLQDVDKWRAGNSDRGPGPMPILIIEGFLVLNHSVLTKYFHKKYFLTIDKETCIERRKHRCYNPPDKPGYFEKVVWPMYLKNRKEMEAQTDIVYLDGTEDQDKVFPQIAADIKQLIDTHSS